VSSFLAAFQAEILPLNSSSSVRERKKRERERERGWLNTCTGERGEQDGCGS